MLHATTPKSTPKKVTRFPDICLAAKELNVDRTHLFRVLTGERKSVILGKRYQAWCKAKKAKNGGAAA